MPLYHYVWKYIIVAHFQYITNTSAFASVLQKKPKSAATKFLRLPLSSAKEGIKKDLGDRGLF